CLPPCRCDGGLPHRGTSRPSPPPGRVHRLVGRQTVRGQGPGAVHRRAGHRRIIGAGGLLLIASGKPGFDLSGGLAANGYAEHSPGGYSLLACLVAEVVLTFTFLLIILGATDGSQSRSSPLLRLA